MFPNGTYFSNQEVMLRLANGKSFHLRKQKINKTPVLVLIANSRSLQCVCCKQTADHFEWHKHGNIRAMFNHTDRQGKRAYMTVDHIIPKSQGGKNTQDNLQLMCNVCNQFKSGELKDATSITSNWLNLGVYVAYIRWYLITFGEAIPRAWYRYKAQAEQATRAYIKDFNVDLFEVAFIQAQTIKN